MILFDAADTLLEKPALYPTMLHCFTEAGFQISLERLIDTHRRLKENFEIPDKTGFTFYEIFNAALVNNLGLPKGDLPEKIYRACGRLEWTAVPDIEILKTFSAPMAILSNWDISLRDKLKGLLKGYSFDPIIVSSEQGLRKPQAGFFQRAIEVCKVAAANILYVGDSPKLDYIPGKAAGMQVLLVDRYSTWSQEGLVTVKSLSEVGAYL